MIQLMNQILRFAQYYLTRFLSQMWEGEKYLLLSIKVLFQREAENKEKIVKVLIITKEAVMLVS